VSAAKPAKPAKISPDVRRGMLRDRVQAGFDRRVAEQAAAYRARAAKPRRR
jgi:hypothetical protein